VCVDRPLADFEKWEALTFIVAASEFDRAQTTQQLSTLVGEETSEAS